MENFWASDVWGGILLIGVLLASLLVANILKKSIPWLRVSLIPTSVLGGGLLLLITGIYRVFSGHVFFDMAVFNGNGSSTLEIITYHALALGFIASTFKTSENKISQKRAVEIVNTGLTTVSTYLLQAVAGMVITMLAALLVKDFFAAAGVLLPFGYGQGTGQALNYGGIFENEFGFDGGKSFGLTIAALGFLSASIGGVIHLVVLKRRGLIVKGGCTKEYLRAEEIQSENEIPMQESIDKMTVQVALIAVAYLLTFGMMFLLGRLLPGMKSVIFGFNFLLGVLSATLIKLVLKLLRKSGMMKKEYTNNFLMTRACNLFFDVMVVAGIAAIRLDMLERYWGIILILGVFGAAITYQYNYFVAKALFPDYAEEQFLTMYGMLTGTASTGIILLREIDGEFSTPAADNMVYQNFPAILFGFPIMLLVTLAPVKPVLTLLLLCLLFVVMNIILFRSFIFMHRRR